MLDIEKKLAKKKYTIPSKFVHAVYKFLALDLVYGKIKFHQTKLVDINECKGPCFVIYNHLSRPDHTFVLKMLYPRRHNMVAGRNEFYRSKFQFIFNIEHVIPKKNYYTDMLTMRGIKEAIESGSTVAFSPEGLASNYGTNKPIVPGTSKMFKHYKIPVYIIKQEGNYLFNSKCCLDERYGELYSTLDLLFTKEDIEKYTVEEMDEIINEKFRHDEYEWQKEKHIKWVDKHHRMAYGLEYLLYKCPTCGKEFEMVSEGDHLYCKNCGHGAMINEYYEFIPTEGSIILDTPVKWADMERLDIINEIRSNPNYEFSDEVEIGNLDNHKYIKDKNATSFKVGRGKLTVNHSGLHYDGTRNGEPYKFSIPWNVIYTTITFTDSSNFSFYYLGELFDIFPKHTTSFKFIFLIEEMHRYHINYYKNFKWYDYMYEGKELGIDNKNK